MRTARPSRTLIAHAEFSWRGHRNRTSAGVSSAKRPTRSLLPSAGGVGSRLPGRRIQSFGEGRSHAAIPVPSARPRQSRGLSGPSSCGPRRPRPRSGDCHSPEGGNRGCLSTTGTHARRRRGEGERASRDRGPLFQDETSRFAKTRLAVESARTGPHVGSSRRRSQRRSPGEGRLVVFGRRAVEIG